MAAKNTAARNHRSSPYLFDHTVAEFHRSAAGVFWRWRVELVTTAALVAGYVELARTLTMIDAALVLAAAFALAVLIPTVRMFLVARLWCVITRHRLQRVCYETRLHTRSGRLPLVVWIRPTKVGERAHVLCRAGICAEDFEAHKAEIGVACYAREARITAGKRWSQLVTVDVVRRDPLGATTPIPSKVLDHQPARLLTFPTNPNGDDNGAAA